MAHGKPRDPRKEQHWRRWVQRWKNSGLTVRDFCARHQLVQPSFYAWRRELQQRDETIAELRLRLAALEARVRDLEDQLGRNATNSSLPPSANPPGAAKLPPKTPTGRTTGAQPGHPAHLRRRLYTAAVAGPVGQPGACLRA